jgi:uncharacterized protein
MKYLFGLMLTVLMFGYAQERSTYHDYPIKSANIKAVILNDNFWLPKIKIIQDTTIQYSFDKCNKEGRMESFLIAGGKKKGKVRGKMPFDDTDLYKIIEGASYSMISNPNPGLDAYLDSIIAIIKIGQESDGYITTWFTIDRLNPPASWVKPSKTRWENEISSHELYNSGHLFEAATAHYLATGKRTFLDIALKNADLLVANFGKGKLQSPPGHQIVETGLIKLYRITGNTKYLELAKFYLDQRGDSTSHKLFGTYSQDHIPVIKQDEVVGHAVRGVYMYAGMTDIAAIYQDSTYLNAVNKLWENMVNKKMYLTGGIGSRHEGESFGDNYELPNLTAYNETCAAIGSVYWNQRLFLLTSDSKYYDVIERTLYNGLIAGISLDGNKFFYPNPLESDGKYDFNMGSCSRQSWFDCSCCPTNLIRFIPAIPGLVYATHKDSLYINLFMSNNFHVSINETMIEIIQKTDYPWKNQINITINPEQKTTFTIKVRIPGWAQNKVVPGNLYDYIGENSGKTVLKINGKDERQVIDRGYMEITKDWIKGDKIEVILPMAIRRVITNERVQENRNLVAVEYGPIVYCAEEIDNDRNISNLVISDNAELRIEEQNILLNRINTITCNVHVQNPKINQYQVVKEGYDVRFVPYYLWSNRSVGKMKIWFPRSN